MKILKKRRNNTPAEKSEDRIKVLKKIEELEEEGKFDVDAEEDPPTIPLKPNQVDYLKEKRTSKAKTKLANGIAISYFKELTRNEKIIIKDINGIENFEGLKTGAIITCNHFNPFDSFTVEKIFRSSKSDRKKKLFKVIREGNYTNFPGLYGFLFRNCYTLPLSQRKETLVEFIKAVDSILERGDCILIFPEQSLWWNYRKPKPLKPGAFNLAARNKVPVIPVFITMEDSDKIGDDGFPIQEYTVNIGKPIYPLKKNSQKENTEMMMHKNELYWKKVYESFYKTKLTYSTKEKKELEEIEKNF